MVVICKDTDYLYDAIHLDQTTNIRILAMNVSCLCIQNHLNRVYNWVWFARDWLERD